MLILLFFNKYYTQLALDSLFNSLGIINHVSSHYGGNVSKE